MKNVYPTTVSPNGQSNQQTAAGTTVRNTEKSNHLRGFMTVILTILFISSSIILKAQTCPTSGTDLVTVNENTYYPGKLAPAAAATSISLGPIGTGTNFGVTPIVAGDLVLIIQMQGAQFYLSTPTDNTLYGANFSGLASGMLATGLQAGLMEFAVATNAVPITGGTLTIASGLVNAYSTSAYTATSGQYTYQVIRVQQHYNLKLNGTITTPAWNGSTGGVTILDAVSSFDFNGNTVNAQGAGFRGGGGRKLSGQTGLYKFDLYSLSTYNADASKGEGVAGTPRYVYNSALVNTGVEGYPGGSYAMGGVGNAGGGASDSDPDHNDQNAGGGGGGNGGAGGNGGNGWYSYGVTGGMGGTRFQTYSPTVKYYSPSRLILGGGGGSGTTNDGTGSPSNGLASSGSAGGGFVIINALTITGTGTVNASAAAPNSTVITDGSGGGGAGGSILIYANSGQSGITALAKGGDGASNNPGGATQHGPGGGGGGGVIYSNGALNAASSVVQGAAGISSGSNATNSYGAAAGFVGVKTETFPLTQLPPNMQICQSNVLPAKIIDFTATYIASNNVKVSWTTTDEVNVNYYTVERNSDAAGFRDIASVSAVETSGSSHAYNVNDDLSGVTENIVYYRLKIVDKDGNISYSKIIPVKLDAPETKIAIHPNPVDNYAILTLVAEKSGTGLIRLMDNSGRQILNRSFTVSAGNNSVMIDQLGQLPKGIYIVQVLFENNLYNQKIVKK